MPTLNLNFNIPGLVVAVAMIVADVVLHITGHPVAEFDTVMPVIAAVYIAGSASTHAAAAAVTAASASK